MELKSLKDIPTSFALAKRAMIMSMVVAFTVVVGCLVFTYMSNESSRENAYILTDTGQLALAKGISRQELSTYREPEVKNHIESFHRLFWNIDQFSMQNDIERSLYLIGNSGKELYLSLKAKGHYTKIKTQNLVQAVFIDSVKINMDIVPYKAAVYGKLNIRRTDQRNEKTDNFTAFFDLLNVTRTDENPHGLLIENYDVSTQAVAENK
ncbi:hypothetical protein [Ascidiimonas sp. W6]|uniref:hypothetical protein n=1 Tax=Ascidiimonas meishanensis TaxID=3128903 RepID=UPI0030ED6FA9